MIYPEGLNEQFMKYLFDTAYSQLGPQVPVYDVQSWTELGNVACSSKREAVQSTLRARAVQDSWHLCGELYRSRMVSGFLRRLLQYDATLISLIQVLSGKSYLDAAEEFYGVMNECRGLKKAMGKLWRPRLGGGKTPFSTYRVSRKPLGVVGMFLRENYPVGCVTEVLTPLLAGNSVVSFVRPQGYLVALLLKALLVDAGLPPDAWRLVVSPTIELGLGVVPALDFVAVWGTTESCSRVEQVARRHGVPFARYSSSKNIAVVMDDAKLWNAAKSIARAAFQNAGNSATAIDVVFVHDSVRERFAGLLTQFTRNQLRAGPYTEPGCNVGSLSHPEQVSRIERVVTAKIEAGAQVLLGSHSRPEMSPTFFEPTILSMEGSDPALLSDEVFGPMVILIPFNDISSVVREMNTSRLIKNICFYTRDISLTRSLIQNCVAAASVLVNDSYLSLYGTWVAPMQGKGETGYGVTHGMESLYQYTRLCSSIELKYISYVPRDMRPGNWVDRLSFMLMGYYAFQSRYIVDTRLANQVRSIWRGLRTRLHGPV